MQYEVDIFTAQSVSRDTSSDDVHIDPGSARELELFMSRLPQGAASTVTRPVIAWRGGVRTVVDVDVSRGERGQWQIRVGNEREATAAPDLAEELDSRLADLTTMVWVTDAERLARWFNHAWLEFVGSDLHSDLGWGWMRHIHADDLSSLLETYEAGHEEQRGFEHVSRTIDRDGRYWWVRVRAAPRFADGMFGGFVGMCERIAPADDGNPPEVSGLPDLLPDLDAASPVGVIERLARLEAVLEVSRPADTLEAGFLRRLTSRWVNQHRALRARHDDIVLAVNEAAANSMIHAYRVAPGRVRLVCEMQPGRAEFRVRDWGSWRVPRPSRESRGIALMTVLADELAIEHLPDGTQVVLRYRV
jgi:PAS domain S-box-containing protein